MRLMELLSAELIKIDLQARSKQEAIEELVDLLVSEHEIRMRDRGPVLAAILKREAQMSTGMEHGIAIPHGTVDLLDEVVAALGISKEGVDFDSLDGKPARLVLLMAIPRNAFRSHVRTLASVARLFNHEEMRDAIIGAKSAEAVLETIHTEEAREFRIHD